MLLLNCYHYSNNYDIFLYGKYNVEEWINFKFICHIGIYIPFCEIYMGIENLISKLTSTFTLLIKQHYNNNQP